MAGLKINKTVGRLLRKNLSKVQLAGFILSNFIGLAIVISGIQFYADVKSIWDNEDSFINRDYIIVNKKVTASHTLGSSSTGFSESDIKDLESQAWLRRLGAFSTADYEVKASMVQGGRGMQTNMFLESIPDDFIDAGSSDWTFRPGDQVVPVIISKDYLALYNFGFASSSGLPQLSEAMISSVPLTLKLSSSDGSRSLTLKARITGFSNRLNTILVPESFMQWSNSELGSGKKIPPQRLILDVSSPGDVAISDYLADRSLERAGEDKGAGAAYFLKLVSGLVIGIGALISVLSIFILLLSVALLMQKNRSKLHTLIMLGYDLKDVARPYISVTLAATAVSYILAIIAMLVFRNTYISGVASLSGENEVGVVVSLLCGAALVVLTLVVNFISIRRKVRSSFLS